MARKPDSQLSRGGKFYRTHREVERTRKRDERARWASSLKAFLEANPDLSMTEREFRREAKREGWLPPNHSPKRRPSKAVDEKQHHFVEGALGYQYGPETYETLYGV